MLGPRPFCLGLDDDDYPAAVVADTEHFSEASGPQVDVAE